MQNGRSDENGLGRVWSVGKPCCAQSQFPDLKNSCGRADAQHHWRGGPKNSCHHTSHSMHSPARINPTMFVHPTTSSPATHRSCEPASPGPNPNPNPNPRSLPPPCNESPLSLRSQAMPARQKRAQAEQRDVHTAANFKQCCTGRFRASPWAGLPWDELVRTNVALLRYPGYSRCVLSSGAETSLRLVGPRQS